MIPLHQGEGGRPSFRTRIPFWNKPELKKAEQSLTQPTRPKKPLRAHSTILPTLPSAPLNHSDALLVPCLHAASPLGSRTSATLSRAAQSQFPRAQSLPRSREPDFPSVSA